MQVELADKAGFCFGVNRAVDTVYREAADGVRPVYTFGPIIHNEEVTADLERKGVSVIDSVEEARKLNGGTLILRSHGVTKAVQDALAATGLCLVDAACPFVKKIHHIVEEYSSKGYFIVIIGNPDHPEVQGIVGWSDPERTKVVNSVPDAENLDLSGVKKLCVVAQTTFHYKKFQDLVEIIRKKGYYSMRTAKEGDEIDFVVHNTICSATRERQEAARALSARVDAMIVIGGASSSNTRKLYEICSENCQNTYFIQTKEDLEHTDFSRFGYVGITAGASTPNNIIEEVQKYVRGKL